MDENTDIIYISPFPLDPDAIDYIMKLLQIGGIENAESRFKIIHPEGYDKYSEAITVSQALFLSQRTMKQVKILTLGKEAYIVPGHVSDITFKIALVCTETVNITALETAITNTWTRSCQGTTIHVQIWCETHISSC